MSKSSDRHASVMQLQRLDQYHFGTLDGVSEVVSDPPQGMFRVLNMYVDPQNGRLIAQYDDET